MNNQEEYIRIYTGPQVIVQLLQSRLEEAGISPIVKDNFESGLRGGFGGGLPGQVQLFIAKDELGSATPIVQETLEDMGEEMDMDEG